jgi:hypothetical protein
MLSYLDPIIFPDQCVVYEIDINRYVYPIFKNGSSSLAAKGYRQLSHEEIRKLSTIEVYIRDPYDRYVSGVQTYLNHLGPEYDRATVLKMISEFLFLNRHFALQFHWLANLARFTDAWLRFRPMEELQTATEHTFNIISRDPALTEYFKDNDKLHYYLELDKILFEWYMGECVSFPSIVARVRGHHYDLYKEVIERNIRLCTVLG